MAEVTISIEVSEEEAKAVLDENYVVVPREDFKRFDSDVEMLYLLLQSCRERRQYKFLNELYYNVLCISNTTNSMLRDGSMYASYDLPYFTRLLRKCLTKDE